MQASRSSMRLYDPDILEHKWTVVRKWLDLITTWLYGRQRAREAAIERRCSSVTPYQLNLCLWTSLAHSQQNIWQPGCLGGYWLIEEGHTCHSYRQSSFSKHNGCFFLTKQSLIEGIGKYLVTNSGLQFFSWVFWFNWCWSKGFEGHCKCLANKWQIERLKISVV